jgi:hypothetical protein
VEIKMKRWMDKRIDGWTDSEMNDRMNERADEDRNEA